MQYVSFLLLILNTGQDSNDTSLNILHIVTSMKRAVHSFTVSYTRIHNGHNDENPLITQLMTQGAEKIQ